MAVSIILMRVLLRAWRGRPNGAMQQAEAPEGNIGAIPSIGMMPDAECYGLVGLDNTVSPLLPCFPGT